MCGRARLAPDWDKITREMHLSDKSVPLNVQPSWNIAPTQDMLVVAFRKDEGRAARLACWGLIPAWAAEPKAMGAVFNAKCETVREKPTFRNAWAKGRRCLVVVDGYYEWRKSDKAPFTIARADGKLMALAGLWERWGKQEGEFVYSCTVVTVPAGPGMDVLHDRAPLILKEADWPVWLGEEPGDPGSVMRPVSAEGLERWQVGRAVGNVRNNGPELAEPLALVGKVEDQAPSKSIEGEGA
jgi:putative SOS response-associated peptidase YedK